MTASDISKFDICERRETSFVQYLGIFAAIRHDNQFFVWVLLKQKAIYCSDKFVPGVAASTRILS
jgi:hypothetical protein